MFQVSSTSPCKRAIFEQAKASPDSSIVSLIPLMTVVIPMITAIIAACYYYDDDVLFKSCIEF